MYRLRTALGRYLPSRNSDWRASRKRSTPRRSTSAIDWRSTPAAPLLRLTRFHASRRTSLLKMRSYSAWNRRSGDRLAAAHSRRWSCRTLSTGRCPWGELDRSDCPAMPSRLPRPPTLPTVGALPSTGVLLHRRPQYYGPLGLPLRNARFHLRFIRDALPRQRLRRRASHVPNTPFHTCHAPYPAGISCALRNQHRKRGLRRDMSGSAPGL